MCLAMCMPGAGMGSMCGTMGGCWWGRFRLRGAVPISVSAGTARCGVLGNISCGGSSWGRRRGGRCWVFEEG